MSDETLEEVVRITRDLIRFDTTTFGPGRAKGESEAADYVQALLEEVGLECVRYDSKPGRTNLVTRWHGTDPNLPALIIHGHLDVVPADPADWEVDPFAGEIRDGMLWGRGAVDMKNMDAMMIASVRSLIRAGMKPRRDLVLAFFADEESGGGDGAQWMVTEHPELFENVNLSITEGGGASITVKGSRRYLLNTGEKGLLWIRLRAKGSAGHASLVARDNAIITLAAAVARLGAEKWPISLGVTTRETLRRLAELTGDGPDADPLELAAAVGPSARNIVASLRNVGNVTMFEAGYKENVVPARASALIDVRFLPGQRDEVIARVQEIVGEKVELEIEMDLISMESPFEGELIDIISDSIAASDEGADVLPYLVAGGTDNRALSRLGIVGYGFVPMLLPEGFDFPAMFHGVNERVPIASLLFGEQVLGDIITRYCGVRLP